MSQANHPMFSCNACGKQYVWKPQLAGRKAKCGCGQIVDVPTEVPVAEVADSSPRCPECGSELAAGAVICVQCGLNLKTGARMGTHLAGPEPAPAPAPRSAAASVIPGVRRRPVHEEAYTGDSRKLVIGGVLLVLVIGIIAGSRYYFKQSQKPQGPMLGRDADAIRMLKEESPEEAKAFLNGHDSRSLGVRWTRNQAMNKIDQWYKMGAKKVWAFTGIICASVVIELPEGAEQRKELFDWAEQWDKDHARKPQKDEGQKYLIIDLMGIMPVDASPPAQPATAQAASA